MASPTYAKRSQKHKKGEKGDTESSHLIFRKRERGFSLKSQAIGPSEFVGTRRKVALRSEAYAWAPILRSFDKLREVGDLSYLVLHFV